MDVITFLRHRADHAFKYILREAEAVSEGEAFLYADPQWRTHKYGIGQDGSIAGIVYHVVAWKMISLPLFQPDGELSYVGDFPENEAPERGDWAGILAWLREVGTQWNALLDAVNEADLERLVPWDKHPIPLWEFAIEMIDHDIQHAAQIEYLRQRLHLEEAV